MIVQLLCVDTTKHDFNEYFKQCTERPLPFKILSTQILNSSLPPLFPVYLYPCTSTEPHQGNSFSAKE